jgi:quercetin dioxygenase-like cupin family protein
MPDSTIPPGDAIVLDSLLSYAEQGIASRVLAKTDGGNVTLFAFDTGQGLSEHTAPFDALVFVLEGTLALTVGGRVVAAAPGTVVRMPANVPHAVEASARSKMLLVMLRSAGKSSATAPR